MAAVTDSSTDYTVRKNIYTRWEETGFPKRVNHSVACCINKHGEGFMYSMGGFKGKGIVRGTGRSAYESWPDLGHVPMDVVELNLDKKEWTRLYPVKETIPVDPPSSRFCPVNDEDMSGRYAHSCVYFDGNLYLYGGRNDYQFFEEVDCFDPVTRQWCVIEATNEYREKASSKDIPNGRYAHACSVDGHIMYIQGGTMINRHSRQIIYTDEIWSFNLLTQVWRMENVVEHNYPLKRDFHTGQYIDGKLFIFGGKINDIHPDDPGFYCYDFGIQKWSKLNTSGYSPLGRRSVQSVRYGQHSIIFFGGFSTEHKIFYSDLFILNTASKFITKVEPFGLGPSPRRRVGLCLLGTNLIICGGVGRDSDKSDLITHNDMYILSLVPSLQFLCTVFVFNENIATANLPSSLRQSLNDISTIQYSDSQALVCN